MEFVESKSAAFTVFRQTEGRGGTEQKVDDQLMRSVDPTGSMARFATEVGYNAFRSDLMMPHRC